MMKFYFVCTGNTCRSPMAEKLFNESFQSVKELFVADSFGLFPDSDTANKHSVKVMEEFGYDLLGFVPSSVEDKNPNKEDLLLTMTGDQRNYLKSMGYINVYTIYEFIGNEDYDIPDPYGQSIQVYRDVRNELDSLMETLYYRLIDYDAD